MLPRLEVQVRICVHKVDAVIEFFLCKQVAREKRVMSATLNRSQFNVPQKKKEKKKEGGEARRGEYCHSAPRAARHNSWSNLILNLFEDVARRLRRKRLD